MTKRLSLEYLDDTPLDITNYWQSIIMVQLDLDLSNEY